MMSRDRVHFKLDPCSMSMESRKAFHRAFGVPVPQMQTAYSPTFPDGGKVIIICRPSQFARFLIYRNDEGGRNGFKELEPKLVGVPDSREFDVSKNPSKGPCSD